MSNPTQPPEKDGLNPREAHETAEARGNTYRLLSQLFLHGLTDELTSYVEAIPELQAELQSSGAYDFDQLAADHYEVLGINVFPYESVFLGTESVMGGAVAANVASAYEQAGFTVDPGRAEDPDHVGSELKFLSRLCQGEAKAWEGELRSEASHLRGLQRLFLDKHLLRWLLMLKQALRQLGHPFYEALAELAWELVLSHREDLATDSSNELLDLALPAGPRPINPDEAGVREIAEYLLTPAISGFYLSRDDIGRLARAHRLPRGFGSRQDMLTNLIRAAASYDRFELLLLDLDALMGAWHDVYVSCSELPGPVALIAAGWDARIEASRNFVRHMRVSAQAEQGEVDNP